MLSDLPQELLELIFTALDPESLRACALVSSSLVAPSQRSIFRSLVIWFPDGDLPKAQALFSSAPHVTGYVRELKVQLEDEEVLSSQNGVLASILPSFPHLECLSIKGWFGPIRWNDTTLPLQSAIEELMTSSNLRSLDVEEIFDIPSSFIVLALSSLRRLGLHSITVEPSESHIPNLPATLRTEEISLRTQYPDVKSIVDLILPNIPRPGYLDKNRRLMLGMHQVIHTESLRIIAATASTLRHLELRCGVFELPLDLPCLPVLRVLELRIFLGFSGPGLPPHLYPVVAALPTTVPIIEVLCLTCYDVPGKEDWGADRAGPLPLFDDTCAYRDKLPYLRRVYCPDRPLDQEDYVAFHVFVLEKFSGLQGTGVLDISAGGDEGPPVLD